MSRKIGSIRRMGMAPLAWLYGSLVGLRNRFYDKGILKSYPVPVRVVSVGNLTWGGTGKTPVIDWLVRHLQQKKFRVAILSRGYRRRSAGFQEVQINKEWSRYGDEPTLLKSRHPEVPVFVDVDRVGACLKIQDRRAADVVLLDDGFQHRRLKRDVDLVVLDATEHPTHYLSAPAGRAREGWSALERAHGIILTKVNLADPTWLSELRGRVSGVPLRVELSYQVAALRDLSTREILPLDRLRGQSVALVSGIGRPESFSALCEQELGAQVIQHFVFPDHHNFTVEDQERVFTESGEKNLDWILMTEKDAIKWQKIPLAGRRYIVVELGLKAQVGEREFLESLDHILSRDHREKSSPPA